MRIRWPSGVSSKQGSRNDIVVKKEISVQAALLGHPFRILHPDGRPLYVKPRSMTMQSGRHYKIANQGLVGRSGERGDMYVEYTITMPDTISNKMREELERIFGPTEPLRRVHHDVEVECVDA